jgi:hypothetical protein
MREMHRCFVSIIFDQCFIFLRLLSEVGHCDICRQQFYKATALNLRRKIALRNAEDVGRAYGFKRLLSAVTLELRRCVLTAVSYYLYICHCGFGGLEVPCWPLVPKFAGSNPAESVGFFGRKKSSARLPSEGK